MAAPTAARAPVGGAGGAAVDAKAAQMMQKKWVGCWRKMVLNETRLGPGASHAHSPTHSPLLLPLQVLRDLHGYPLWETEVHDVLAGLPGAAGPAAAPAAAPFSLARPPPRRPPLPPPPRPLPSPPSATSRSSSLLAARSPARGRSAFRHHRDDGVPR